MAMANPDANLSISDGTVIPFFIVELIFVIASSATVSRVASTFDRALRGILANRFLPVRKSGFQVPTPIATNQEKSSMPTTGTELFKFVITCAF